MVLLTAKMKKWDFKEILKKTSCYQHWNTNPEPSNPVNLCCNRTIIMAWTPTGTHVAITLVDLAAVADKLLRRSTKHSQSQYAKKEQDIAAYKLKTLYFWGPFVVSLSIGTWHRGNTADFLICTAWGEPGFLMESTHIKQRFKLQWRHSGYAADQS